MFDDPNIFRTVVTSGAAFGCIFFAWGMALLIWTRKQRKRDEQISQRMGFNSAETSDTAGRILRLWHDGREATTIVPGKERAQSFLRRLDQMRHDAGWETPMQMLILMVGGLSLLLFVVGFMVTNNIIVATCAGAFILMAFMIFLKQAISKRTALFERQLVDALELAARSLRVGQPLVGSFELIAEEVDAPVGPLFAGICQQQGLGVGLDDAIRSAARDSGSADMKFFATSVVIQLRSGGNLADMMDRLAFVIRDRMRLARRVRVLTAQTQFSKRILQALPCAIFVILCLINPEYMQPLYTTSTGKTILGIAGAGLLTGTYIMNRLAVIRY
jgi:tight adherence protein B